MEFLSIEAGDKERWEKVWELYEDSFPIAERRKVDDHLRACNDERFFPLSAWEDRKSTRLNSSHVRISYAVFCLKKKKKKNISLGRINKTKTEKRRKGV